MVMNEYKDDYKELSNIMDILFTKNQYFFSKISETLYLDTSNIIEPIFNNLRGERLTKTVIEEDKYIANYKVSDRERPLRLIGQKESIILLLIYNIIGFKIAIKKNTLIIHTYPIPLYPVRSINKYDSKILFNPNRYSVFVNKDII